jgi:hypothetical protein
MHTKFLSVILNGRVHSQDLGVDGSTILEFISEKYNGKVWTGFIWCRQGKVAGFVNTVMKLRVP